MSNLALLGSVHLLPVTFSPTTFMSLQPTLDGLLDQIAREAHKGKPIPKQAKAPPGVTDTGAKAYGESYNKAKEVVTNFVAGLTPDDLESLSGMGFTDPNDDAKKRTDVVNTVMSAWDRSASNYMKMDIISGDAGKSSLQFRLQELDAAIQDPSTYAVTPDQ